MQSVAIKSQDGQVFSISTVSAIGDEPDEVYQAFEISYHTDPGLDDILDIYSIEDIFLLKDAIDAFILLNNLYEPMKKPAKPQQPNDPTTPQPVPGYCRILEGFLKGWAPADASGAGTLLRTSQDIVDELSDMVDIDTCSLASIMAQLGFRVHYDPDGPHGWMMRRDQAAVYTILPSSGEGN